MDETMRPPGGKLKSDPSFSTSPRLSVDCLLVLRKKFSLNRWQGEDTNLYHPIVGVGLVTLPHQLQN